MGPELLLSSSICSSEKSPGPPAAMALSPSSAAARASVLHSTRSVYSLMAAPRPQHAAPPKPPRLQIPRVGAEESAVRKATRQASQARKRRLRDVDEGTLGEQGTRCWALRYSDIMCSTRTALRLLSAFSGVVGRPPSLHLGAFNNSSRARAQSSEEFLYSRDMRGAAFRLPPLITPVFTSGNRQPLNLAAGYGSKLELPTLAGLGNQEQD